MLKLTLNLLERRKMLDKDNRKKVPKHRAEPKVKNKSNLLYMGTLGITVTLCTLGVAMPPASNAAEVSTPAIQSSVSSSYDVKLSQKTMDSLKVGIVKDVVVPLGETITLERVAIKSEAPPEPTYEEKLSTILSEESDSKKKTGRRALGVPVASVGSATVLSPAETAKLKAASSRVAKWVNPVPQGVSTSQFGHRAGIPAAGVAAGMHNGIDLAAPMGSAIYAAQDGLVVHTGFTNFDTHTGGIVVVLHKTAAGNFLTSYNHMKTSGVLVKVGDMVKGGEKIAEIGSEGKSSGPHLHFSVRKVTGPDVLKDWKIIDPKAFMATNGVNL
jgi:murein DD-endopeptidase MepM/ murein hydrolase activator NlpD